MSEMNDQKIDKHDQVLVGLVMSLQAAAMQHLGKLTSPMTGKIERDLEQARGTIDILEMLKVKCRQGTPTEILRLLDDAVMGLQMNYLDEMRKEQATAQAASESDRAGASEAAANEQEAEAGGGGAGERDPDQERTTSGDAVSNGAVEGAPGTEGAGDKET